MVSPGAVKATLIITVTLSALVVSATHTSYTDNTTHKSVNNDHNGATMEAEATVVLTAGKTSKTVLNVAEGPKGGAGKTGASGQQVLNAAQAGMDVSEGLTSSKSSGAGQDTERDAEEAEDAEYAAASPTNFVLHDCFPGKFREVLLAVVSFVVVVVVVVFLVFFLFFLLLLIFVSWYLMLIMMKMLFFSCYCCCCCLHEQSCYSCCCYRLN